MPRKRPDPAYHAPTGSSSPGYRMPGYSSPEGERSTPSRRPGSVSRREVRLPAVDDRLATPEAGEEYLDGRRMLALPADAAHADPQCQLAYVVRACVAEGYVASTELLTRADKGSDFATDVCVRKAGTDPETGGRYLEELSFEVASTQTLARLKPRARKLIARGVRRLFAVLVREGEVREWTESKGWRLRVADGEIRDRTLKKPLRIGAILDAAAADRLVAEALWAKREPFLVGIARKQWKEGREEGRKEGREEGRTEGRAEGLAEAILRALDAHGLQLGDRERRALSSCADAEILSRWLDKALVEDTAKGLVTELEK